MLWLAVSCEKTPYSKGGGTSDGTFPIALGSGEVSATKAVSNPGLGDTTDTKTLASKGAIGIFGVKASSIVASGDNIFSQTNAVRLTPYTDADTYKAEYDNGTSWTYRDASKTNSEKNLVYWQIGAFHRFRAFHPYDEVVGDSDNSNIHSESYADQLMIHYSVARDNYDLLYASAWRYPSSTVVEDGTTQTTAAADGYPALETEDKHGIKNVKLNFKHALAALRFKIQLASNSAKSVDYLENFYVTGLNEAGLFICKDDLALWGDSDKNKRANADASYWYVDSANEFDENDTLYLYKPTGTDGEVLTGNSILNAFGRAEGQTQGTLKYKFDVKGTEEEYYVGPLSVFGGTKYVPTADGGTTYYTYDSDGKGTMKVISTEPEAGLVFVIPQQPSAEAGKETYVHFKVWNKEGKTYTKQIPATTTDSNGNTVPVKWEMGKIYTYTIEVGPVDVKINVSIEDWEKEETNFDIYL